VLLPFLLPSYSPECVEGFFCELPLYGVLKKFALPRSNTYGRPAIGPGQYGYSANVVNFACVAFRKKWVRRVAAAFARCEDTDR